MHFYASTLSQICLEYQDKYRISKARFKNVSIRLVYSKSITTNTRINVDERLCDVFHC